jgi:hypothetical protein
MNQRKRFKIYEGIAIVACILLTTVLIVSAEVYFNSSSQTKSEGKVSSTPKYDTFNPVPGCFFCRRFNPDKNRRGR